MATVVEYRVPQLYDKQLLFCQSKTKFTLYGGARGGGKSFVVRHKAIQLALLYDGIQILIVRRTFPELEENHIKHFRILLHGIAKYKTQDKLFRFQNGSSIKFGYCNTEADMENYQGQAYEAIFVDEATHFTEYMYMKFTEILRPSGLVNLRPNQKSLPTPRMYLTANPGGVGHLWVKRLFIDCQYKEKEKPENYSFIPALVFDNQFILENDPSYVETLEALPEKERQAMLYGDWDVFEGQFFTEFDEAIHTFTTVGSIDEEDDDENKICIRKNWRKIRARDYGLDMTDCLWAALDENDTLYVYRELSEKDLIVSASGNKINALTLPHEKPYLDICPPDMWNRRQETGQSAVDILRNECGQYPIKANNDRENGWLQVHERLKTSDITGKPKLRIEKSCIALIKSLKMIQHDEKKVNDCAKEPHEITHAADAVRYLCTSYTYPPDPMTTANQPREFDYGQFAMNYGDYAYSYKNTDDRMIDMTNDEGWFLN